MSEVEVALDKRVERPLVKCPYCDYTCRGTQALGRHIHYHHPEECPRQPKVSLKPETLRVLLQLIDRLISQGQLQRISGPLQETVREQELKVYLTLVGIAGSRALRAADQEALLDKLSQALQEKLSDEAVSKLTIEQNLKIQKAIRASVTEAASYLREVLSMQSGGSPALFVRATEVLQHSDRELSRLTGPDSELREIILATQGQNPAALERILGDIISSESNGATGGVLEAESGGSRESPEETPSGSSK